MRSGQRYPRIGLEIARNIARRIHSSNKFSSVSGSRAALSVALIPVSESLDHQAFARRLTDEMEAFGRTLRFDMAGFDQLYGRPGAAGTDPSDPTNIPILGWLTQLEEQHRFILYQADRTMTPWTSRCLRQADRLVLLVDPRDDASVRTIERQILDFNPRARIELLLLHDDGSVKPGARHRVVGAAPGRALPSRTGRLPSRLPAFHPPPDGAADRPGALGAGAVRGFCHFGVYRALTEAGVEIDMIGGTSAGSLVGAVLAMDSNLEELQDKACHFSKKKELLDYTYPAASLIKGKRTTENLRQLYGLDAAIEDLFLPFLLYFQQSDRDAGDDPYPGAAVAGHTRQHGHSRRDPASELPGPDSGRRRPDQQYAR